jgi:CRP/FNR family transcriptional regulator
LRQANESVCHRASTLSRIKRQQRGRVLSFLDTGPDKIGPNTLLTGLPREISGRLLAGERAVTLAAGETLFERGDAGDGCYWLRSGVVKVCVASDKGEQRILAILGPGAIVGEMAMIDGLPRSASVQAVRACELTFVSRAAFTEVLRQHPELYADIVRTLATRLRHSDEDMAASSFLTVRARVARALMQFAQQLGEDAGDGLLAIPHRITQSDLAAMAGVARESVSRTLRDWKRNRLLERASSTGYVVHKTKLEREAQAVE